MPSVNLSRLSPGAVQLMLPFMERLAMSPKAEQPLSIAKSMMSAVEPAGASPWQRLLRMVPKAGGMANEDLALFPEGSSRMSFAFKPRGTEGELAGSVQPGGDPRNAYLSYLGSTSSRRLGTGDVNTPMQDYRMDISSPAQREFGGRGFQPPRQPGAQVMRVPEERAGQAEAEGSGLPRATMAQKQQAADAFLGLLRKAGFQNLNFSAEAGERPRLYEKLTGYKAQPVGETKMESLLGMMPGRAYQGEAMSPGTYRSPLSGYRRSQALNETDAAAHPVIREALSGSALSREQAELALGLTVDEGLSYGLIHGTNYGGFHFTPEGARQAREWMGQLGSM